MLFTVHTEKDGKMVPIETVELDLGEHEKELKEYGKLFCNCGYLQDHGDESAKYVENYKGVKHGWICPQCEKFVQIG